MTSEILHHQTHTHTYRDLRSEHRARNRNRKHLKKYGNFRSIFGPIIQPNDLPSSSSQQAHHVPVDNPNSFFPTFPADLSTAPVAKFTKREAYDEAQWLKAPTYKRSSPQQKKFLNWQSRTANKKATKQQILSREWYDDIWGWMGLEYLDEHWEEVDPPCPCDGWDIFDFDRLVGSNSDDYRSSDNLTMRSKDGLEWIGEAMWHRHPVHGWFRLAGDCEEGTCACVAEWDEPICWRELDKVSFYAFADRQDGGDADEGYVTEGVSEDEYQDIVDEEWDMLSNAPSTVWSEIDYP
ncbi:hypothetical protein B0J11DRAFT_538756 [Dendryphion nanum]|uniref:Uncharacterized protein n=1 Tax=Dendryphion nanum TaxID=256645 RepID=A0A9P9DB02_9PLEO|nr:hypothetical protein B0J11DRAFT_538756 [Dendryphion nanum]